MGSVERKGRGETGKEEQWLDWKKWKGEKGVRDEGKRKWRKKTEEKKESGKRRRKVREEKCLRRVKMWYAREQIELV